MTAHPLLNARVDGIPRPQGSLTTYGLNAKGKAMLSHSQPLLQWRADVVDALRDAKGTGWVPIDYACAIRLSFRLPRPQRHFTSSGDLRHDAPHFMSNGSDLDKLTRAIFDAMTVAGVLADDRHVAIVRSEKVYADGETYAECQVNAGVRIEVWTI